MKKKYIVIATILLLFFFFLGQNKTNKSVVTQQKITPTIQLLPQTKKVGDHIELNGYIYSLDSVRIDKGNDLFKPKEGNQYVIVKMTLQNNTKKSMPFSTLLQLYIKGDKNIRYITSIGPEIQGSLDTNLVSGDVNTGEVAFEIPENDKKLRLYLQPIQNQDNYTVFDLGI